MSGSIPGGLRLRPCLSYSGCPLVQEIMPSGNTHPQTLQYVKNMLADCALASALSLPTQCDKVEQQRMSKSDISKEP